MAMGLAIGALAGTTAAAAYIDARFHIKKDISTIVRTRNAGKEHAKAVRTRRQSCFYLFDNAAVKYDCALVHLSRSGTYTWLEMRTRSYQYANHFLKMGLEPGDLVSLYSQNSPEYIFILFGLWAIGCAPAMINWNLGGDALVHCANLAGAKVMIVDEEPGCQARIAEQKPRLECELVTLSERLKAEIASSDASRPADSYRESLAENAPACLIYTSGTTGMPKAFPILHSRIYALGVMAGSSVGKTPGKDRWYVCMPLYHATGIVSAVINLMGGMSLALGRTFSLSQFWSEVRDSEATALVYVGETARFLLSAPPSPLDKQHKVRLVFGNGLRPDVWGKFQERFGIPEVSEFFSSTEGEFTVAVWARNEYFAKAVGHHGAILRALFNQIYVPVKVDPKTGDMYRSTVDNFARRAKYEDGGEILVKLARKESWPGYWRSKEASEKKFAFSVFEAGDVYYRPGDDLRRNSDGFWYFMDRLGDTYRWKSENVSTAEVGDVLGHFPGVLEANVYGVEVPRHEGRAGCAAVAIGAGGSDGLDWTALAKYAHSRLPRYAVPVFIRVMGGKVGETATHNNKQNKVPYRQEGVDPKLRGSKVPGGGGDVVYWLPNRASGYVPFTDQDWNGIVEGKAML